MTRRFRMGGPEREDVASRRTTPRHVSARSVVIRYLGTSARWLVVLMSMLGAVYVSYAGVAYYRYGAVDAPDPAAADPLLDRFMPSYEVAERHQIAVHAPAALTLNAARETSLESSLMVRSIIRAREVLMGATGVRPRRLPGLLKDMQALGWGVLSDVPEREVVVGAVTRPWEANVTFRALPPDQFAAFAEPGYVKIVWTLRADRVSTTESIFRTETRVMTTDAAARARFRRYWALVSPGIITIRWALLRPVKLEAERRAREGAVSRTVTGCGAGRDGHQVSLSCRAVPA